MRVLLRYANKPRGPVACALRDSSAKRGAGKRVVTLSIPSLIVELAESSTSLRYMHLPAVQVRPIAHLSHAFAPTKAAAVHAVPAPTVPFTLSVNAPLFTA